MEMLVDDGGVIGFYEPRQDVTRGEPVWSGASRVVRPVEPIAAQDAPDPVRQSDFNTRPSRYPKAVHFNIADIQSVQQDEFGYPTFAPQHTAAFALGYGGQLPWEERVNIVSPQSVPYGSQMTINPPQEYYPLMGV